MASKIQSLVEPIMQNLKINEEFLNFDIWTRMTNAIKQEYQAETEYLNVKLICNENKYILVRHSVDISTYSSRFISDRSVICH